MAKLANEAGTVQFPLVKHAEENGWAVISQEDALHRRRGEGGLFLYKDLEDALLQLNPGIVTSDNVQGIIQRIEAIPATIAGNLEVLEWLRGNRTEFLCPPR